MPPDSFIPWRGRIVRSSGNSRPSDRAPDHDDNLESTALSGQEIQRIIDYIWTQMEGVTIKDIQTEFPSVSGKTREIRKMLRANVVSGIVSSELKKIGDYPAQSKENVYYPPKADIGDEE